MVHTARVKPTHGAGSQDQTLVRVGWTSACGGYAASSQAIRKAERDGVEGSVQLGRLAHARMASILLKVHVTSVVQTALDVPVTAHHFQETLRNGHVAWQAGDPAAHRVAAFSLAGQVETVSILRLGQIRPVRVALKGAAEPEGALSAKRCWTR